jgi:hypothetical protein
MPEEKRQTTRSIAYEEITINIKEDVKGFWTRFKHQRLPARIKLLDCNRSTYGEDHNEVDKNSILLYIDFYKEERNMRSINRTQDTLLCIIHPFA